MIKPTASLSTTCFASVQNPKKMAKIRGIKNNNEVSRGKQRRGRTKNQMGRGVQRLETVHEEVNNNVQVDEDEEEDTTIQPLIRRSSRKTTMENVAEEHDENPEVEWKREVAFAGFDVPIQMALSAEKLIFGVSGVDPKRRSELINIFDIDLSWKMHKVSDGQRRRVQICMGPLKAYKVLLLDEITVDLDVLARANLLRFLRKECEERGATIIYATHIFDGLENWPSHMVYVSHGKLQLAMPMDKIKENSKLSLMRTVESWLRKERDEERTRRRERKASGLPEFEEQIQESRVIGDPARSAVRVVNNGWAAGRLHSTLAGEENFLLSSNRVLRQ